MIWNQLHDWRRYSRRALAASLAVSLSVLVVLPASAQETVSVIRENGQRFFADGDFQSALPYFEQLIDIQGRSKVQQVIYGLETIYYNAAMCRFLTADFPGAIQAFNRYNKKYPHGTRLHESFLYIADSYRYSNKLDEAIRQYRLCLKKFSYQMDLRTDIHAAIASCYLAQDEWDKAVEPLKDALETAPDLSRRNRAATLLATAYLKTMRLEDIYLMVPSLLTRDSLASRSIAFNMAALEAGDALFSDERYREAFWIHRLIYPYNQILDNTEAYVKRLKTETSRAQRYVSTPRYLMRLQEWTADAEAELKALQEGVENYDIDLLYRIARGYMEAGRYREAFELFLNLHETGGEERAEECLYLAFICATHFPPRTRCYAVARMYMDDYPAGEYYDVLTLMAGQMMAQEADWKAVIRHFSEVLRVRPAHQSAAECLYLLGYAHFMEEEFEQSLARFQEIREKFPKCDLMPDAVYWSAMASIFNGDFAAGEKDFTELIETYPACRYIQDALYRRGVCSYALGQFDLAEKRLADFVTAWPTNDLVAEAVMTRGDIAGAVGRLDDAVSHYQIAMDAPTNHINIEQYNHCAFQAGEILFDSEEYGKVRDHFKKYVQKNRPESNIPLAVYWIGRAMLQQGERQGALNLYRDAALRFGKDRLQVGVDMILDEWVATTRRCTPDEQRVAWQDLGYTIRKAKTADDPVSALRFQRLKLYKPDLTPSQRERELDSICKLENLAYAGPAVMETMLDTAKARHQTNFAVRVATAIIKDFTETDYALDARIFLADVALAQAAAEPDGSERAEKLYAGAIRNLTVVREVYATTPEAAEALLKLGDIYAGIGEPEKADDCFKSVLGVRDWRPLWPKALFGRGLCAERARDWLKASAYYERIYVMYSGYRDITAKAYLARAKCLRKGYEQNKAIETLQAMLENEDLARYPEFEEAKRLLSAMGGAAK